MDIQTTIGRLLLMQTKAFKHDDFQARSQVKSKKGMRFLSRVTDIGDIAITGKSVSRWFQQRVHDYARGDYVRRCDL